VYSVNRFPSSMNRKLRMAWKQASNSLGAVQLPREKPKRLPRVRRPPSLLQGAADVVSRGIHHGLRLAQHVASTWLPPVHAWAWT
jgi:hypothetical protein